MSSKQKFLESWAYDYLFGVIISEYAEEYSGSEHNHTRYNSRDYVAGQHELDKHSSKREQDPADAGRFVPSQFVPHTEPVWNPWQAPVPPRPSTSRRVWESSPVLASPPSAYCEQLEYRKLLHSVLLRKWFASKELKKISILQSAWKAPVCEPSTPMEKVKEPGFNEVRARALLPKSQPSHALGKGDLRSHPVESGVDKINRSSDSCFPPHPTGLGLHEEHVHVHPSSSAAIQDENIAIDIAILTKAQRNQRDTDEIAPHDAAYGERPNASISNDQDTPQYNFESLSHTPESATQMRLERNPYMRRLEEIRARPGRESVDTEDDMSNDTSSNTDLEDEDPFPDPLSDKPEGSGNGIANGRSASANMGIGPSQPMGSGSSDGSGSKGQVQEPQKSSKRITVDKRSGKVSGESNKVIPCPLPDCGGKEKFICEILRKISNRKHNKRVCGKCWTRVHEKEHNCNIQYCVADVCTNAPNNTEDPRHIELGTCNPLGDERKQSELNYVCFLLGINPPLQLEDGEIVDHVGQRQSFGKRKALKAVAEDAAHENFQLRESLRGCEHSREDFRRQLQVCQQQIAHQKQRIRKLEQRETDLLSVLEHALEEFERSKLPLPRALRNRLGQHAPGILDLASNTRDQITSMSNEYRTDAILQALPSYDSTNGSAPPPEQLQSIATQLTASLSECLYQSHSLDLSEPAAKRQRRMRPLTPTSMQPNSLGYTDLPPSPDLGASSMTQHEDKCAQMQSSHDLMANTLYGPFQAQALNLSEHQPQLQQPATAERIALPQLDKGASDKHVLVYRGLERTDDIYQMGHDGKFLFDAFFDSMSSEQENSID